MSFRVLIAPMIIVLLSCVDADLQLCRDAGVCMRVKNATSVMLEDVRIEETEIGTMLPRRRSDLLALGRLTEYVSVTFKIEEVSFGHLYWCGTGVTIFESGSYTLVIDSIDMEKRSFQSELLRN